MDKKFRTSTFARLYVWAGRAKYTMGLFFAGFTLMYLFFGLVSEGPAVTMDLFTSLEMMIAGALIGMAQQFLVPTGVLTRARSVLWVVIGIAVTLSFSLIFGWFSMLPLWGFICFQLFAAFGLVAMILMYYFELYGDTKELNRGLEQFQQQGR